MREFCAPQVGARGRKILAAVLIPLGVIPLLIGVVMLPGSSRISYTVAAGELIIFSGGLFDRERRVPLDRITRARLVETSRGKRSFGTALPGYCVGRFSYSELGSVWQATSCSRAALLLELRGEERPWLISPPDREAFLARLGQREPIHVDLPPARKQGYLAIIALLLLLAAVVMGMTAAVFFWGPSRLRYRVGRGVLEIRSIFGRRRWPVAQLRARLHRPQVSLRIAGSAMPGYYTGLFRMDGKNTRLYATQLKADGVLLEGPARVFLSPEDPAAFLAALAAEGARVEGETK